MASTIKAVPKKQTEDEVQESEQARVNLFCTTIPPLPNAKHARTFQLVSLLLGLGLQHLAALAAPHKDVGFPWPARNAAL